MAVLHSFNALILTTARYFLEKQKSDREKSFFKLGRRCRGCLLMLAVILIGLVVAAAITLGIFYGGELLLRLISAYYKCNSQFRIRMPRCTYCSRDHLQLDLPRIRGHDYRFLSKDTHGVCTKKNCLTHILTGTMLCII